MLWKKLFSKYLSFFLGVIFFYGCDVQKGVLPRSNSTVISVCLGTTNSYSLVGTQPVTLVLNTNPQCNQTAGSSTTDIDAIESTSDLKGNLGASNLPHWASSNPTCASVDPENGNRTTLTINSSQKCNTTITVEFNNKESTLEFSIDPGQAPQPYEIRGSVSGLSGTGLVLQNNGGDNLSISSNGNFTFSTAVIDGNSYHVTVLTQPSSPDQICTVNNGLGIVNGSNVTNVSVVCVTTYAIGGNVSGLSGTGLVLQNNGGDNLSISLDGSFTFSTKLADGSAYNVTVLTQPSNPNQTCTVNNGSGTLNGSDVTNVSVVCATNTYTIGGSVSGLSGTGLVLQNNGGDNLSISSNGSFAFSTAITDGNAYNVTVLTQPSTPNQTCTVSNASGTVNGGNVTNVSVSCVTLILNPATDVSVSGQNVTLTNNSTSQASGFTLIFSNTGSLTCSSVVIQTTATSTLIPSGSTFLPTYTGSSELMPQFTCVKTGSDIELSSAPPLAEGFHPWADNFNIVIDTTTFAVTVNTPDAATQTLARGAQSVMNLDSSFAGCGLRGTILQRVFDCSKKITNYGATVTAGQSASSATGSTSGTYYTAYSGTNPELYWFVVACPATGGSSTVPQQSCHWLTPVVPVGNPALDSTGVGTFPTFQLSMMITIPTYMQRLLLSGKMINDGTGYFFSQSNGFNYAGGSEVYTYDAQNPGKIPTTAQPTHTSNSVCVATTGNSLQGGGTFLASDANIRDIVSYATGAPIGSLGIAQWQIPSFAMLNIITGGRPTFGSGVSFCPASGNGASRPNCNLPLPTPGNNQGFSAINVPGFAQTNVNPPSACSPPVGCPEGLWTSSSTGTGSAWAFMSLYSSVAGFLENAAPNFGSGLKFGTRCVALKWY